MYYLNPKEKKRLILEYDTKEQSTFSKDKNRKLLFEGDIVFVKHSFNQKGVMGFIYYDMKHLDFHCLNIENVANFKSLPLSSISTNNITFYAYIFQNDDLTQYLKFIFDEHEHTFNF